jgi:hypothetical protein
MFVAMDKCEKIRSIDHSPRLDGVKLQNAC